MSDRYIVITTHPEEPTTLSLQQDWTIHHVSAIEGFCKELAALPSGNITLDGSKIGALDTSGAWLLMRLIRRLNATHDVVDVQGFAASHQKILEIIEHIEHPDSIPCQYCGVFSGFVKHVGHASASMTKEIYSLVAFFGQVSTTIGSVLLNPMRLRMRSLIYHINEIGIKALPIIILMAFLISMVMGYQGATQLQQFGATIFTIDLVAISLLREMGVLITAIMVAGRSGSAFAAQIGVMKINEEVDAMRTIGLDPFEMLVLPRVFAIVIALPILTFIADIVGLFGTLFVSSTLLDISLLQFLERLKGAVTVETFAIGLLKAPIFGVLIGIVSCLQGMQVDSSAAEVGARTTTAVVRSIFLVILADAAFSILFTMLGI